MKNKTVVITGATSGIGRISAIEIAKKGANLVLLGRNEQKLDKVIEEVSAYTSNVKKVVADFSSLEEIRRSGDEVKSQVSHIDVLLNNAGLMLPDRKLTKDGFEYTFALNHLGYFLFTGLLIDVIKSTPKSRIVSVSSAAHKAGKIYFDDLMFEKKYSSFKVYAQSKLANVLFTYELARKLEGTDTTVNCLHPGVVKTGFGQDFTGFFAGLMKVFSPLMLTAEKGAETSIYLATSPEVEGVTGKYFVKKKAIESSEESYNQQTAKKLWSVSEELSGIKY